MLVIAFCKGDEIFPDSVNDRLRSEPVVVVRGEHRCPRTIVPKRYLPVEVADVAQYSRIIFAFREAVKVRQAFDQVFRNVGAGFFIAHEPYFGLPGAMAIKPINPPA